MHYVHHHPHFIVHRDLNFCASGLRIFSLSLLLHQCVYRHIHILVSTNYLLEFSFCFVFFFVVLFKANKTSRWLIRHSFKLSFPLVCFLLFISATNVNSTPVPAMCVCSSLQTLVSGATIDFLHSVSAVVCLPGVSLPSSGVMSMRCALLQTTKSIMNARNIMPAVIP